MGFALDCGMPRKPRKDFPGAFHHIVSRGIEKRDIFQDDRDREELLRRVRLNMERFKAGYLAWAFMPNHFHLLFHSAKGNLRDFMRCLLTGYSMYFNYRHERVGHLFQNRYISRIVDSDPYLLELIRYIHLNPLRAGLVATMEELDRYRWTGHHEFLKSGNALLKGFLGFGKNRSQEIKRHSEGDGAIKWYQTFLREGLRIGHPSVRISLHHDSFPCDPSDGRTAKLGEEENDQASIPYFRETVEAACRSLGISAERLLGRRKGRAERDISKARRNILIYYVKEKGIPKRLVCERLGITMRMGEYLLSTCVGKNPANLEYTSSPPGIDGF